MSNEKGSFSADISDSAIEAALRSVEARERPASPDPEPASEAMPQPSLAPDASEEVVTVEVEVDATNEQNGELAELRAQLELSQAKGRETLERLKDTHERMLRTAADLDNFKKRAQREREDAQRFGVEKLLKDFLPVLDNLDRALEHTQQSPDLDTLIRGVQMTRKQFEAALGRHGVKGFSGLGQTFDPRLHEAMQQVETADVPPNQVVTEMARGYFLHDRLIRPAMVVVSAVKQTPPNPEEGAS